VHRVFVADVRFAFLPTSIPTFGRSLFAGLPFLQQPVECWIPVLLKVPKGARKSWAKHVPAAALDAINFNDILA